VLKPGDRAPDFRLAASDGGQVGLGDLRGRRVVLYFYPKDMTPGCTREACDFRDRASEMRAAGAEVVGISKDPTPSHRSFIEKYELTFPLLSDPDNRVARAYGAFGEKVLYGRKTMGTIRSTFLIDPNGTVEAAWSPVRVDGHADAVLARLKGDSAGPSPRAARGGSSEARPGASRSGRKAKPAATRGRSRPTRSTSRPRR
jgi:thioredoxin-dependent peroxiredoxin